MDLICIKCRSSHGYVNSHTTAALSRRLAATLHREAGSPARRRKWMGQSWSHGMLHSWNNTGRKSENYSVFFFFRLGFSPHMKWNGVRLVRAWTRPSNATEPVSNRVFTIVSEIPSTLLISAVDLAVFYMSTQEENGCCFDSSTSTPGSPLSIKWTGS